MAQFSIVIPTRNRAHLLRSALKSALTQTFKGDYEIVVSDNDSSDDTPRVVEEFKDKRVRYFRTSKTLSMPEHWEFALQKTSGEWVTYLQDRAVVSKCLLEIISAALSKKPVSLISWTTASYISDSWYDPNVRNQLLIFPFSGEIMEMDSKEMLSRLFYRFYAHNSQPVMLNSFCRRDLIQAIQKKMGSFFLPICPDYASCIAMLALTQHYTYVDLPLRVAAQTKESTGGSQSHNRGEASQNFIKEFRDAPFFQHVPLMAHVMDNYISESILRVKEKMPKELENYKLNWSHYFVRCYTQLQHLSWQGVDITAEKRDFYQVLNRQPLKFRFNVIAMLIAKGLPIYPMRMRGRRFIDGSPFLVKLDQLIRKTPQPIKTLRGNEIGFNDVLGALSCLENLLQNSIG